MKKVIKWLVIILIIISIVIIINIARKNNKVIVCVDAGHGGIDTGGTMNGRYEKDDTLKLAKLIEEKLKQQDIKLIMTRNEVKDVGLQERCDIANKKKTKIFVSLHRDCLETGKGLDIWTNSQKDDKDVNLAKLILNNLAKKEIQHNGGIKHGTNKGSNTDYSVLNNTKMPSCLIELGYISNDKDNELFDKNLEEYANAISKGIIQYIEVNG